MNDKINISASDDGIYYPDSCTPLANAWQAQQFEMNVLARETYPGYPLKDGELKGIKSIGYWNSENRTYGQIPRKRTF